MSEAIEKPVSPFKSTLTMGVGIVALATGLVCGLLLFLITQSEEKTARAAVAENARNVTVLQSGQLAGAVRFNDQATLQRALDSISEMAGASLVSAAIFNVESQPLGEMERAFSADVAALVGASLSDGSLQVAQNGLLVGAPIAASVDSPTVGVLVTEWTAEPKLAALAAGREQQLLLVAGVFLGVLCVAAFLFRGMIARPISALSTRTMSMEKGDLTGAVPCMKRQDEVGATARSLETLRQSLEVAEAERQKTSFLNAAFGSATAALLLADKDLIIKEFNPAFQRLMSSIDDGFVARGIDMDLDNLIGENVDVFHPHPSAIRGQLETAKFPMNATIKLGDYVVTLSIAPVRDAEGEHAGYLLEWRDDTKDLSNKAIIDAIDAAQWRARFDKDGVLKKANQVFFDGLPGSEALCGSANLADIVRSGGDKIAAAALDGQSTTGMHTFAFGGQERIINGIFSPLKDTSGRPDGFILIATDVTEAEARLRQATEEAEAAKEAQDHAVNALKRALSTLADGDLSSRLSEALHPDYESLQHEFNTSVSGLDNAVAAVLENAGSILGEASNISDAAGDLSHRTEQQAAT
ncbi:MAG: HAMP domain-containing protein, partial [Pseudomonadota bacterium]